MIKAMADQWIIRVLDREYGPADLATLHEWKTEGRLLPTNDARKVDIDSAAGADSAKEVLWSTAATIPGLFETSAPPVQTEPEVGEQKTEDTEKKSEIKAAPRPCTNILRETFQIYFAAFFQYLGLTLLIIGPSLCAQITSVLIKATPNVDVDLAKLIEAGFTFCMLLLTIMLWPVYIAGIQILTAQRATGYQVNFLSALNDAVKFWPRAAFLCIYVYFCFAFWTFFPAAIALGLMVGAPSLSSIFLALLVIAFMVWITGRLFVNFLFWQQFAVLDNCDVGETLRRSKELARSGRELPWHRRPMWRGVFIASLWFAFVMACNWPFLRDYFRMVTTTTDPQMLLEAMRKMSTTPPTNLSLGLGFLQSVLRPLLGIAFVLLYFDSKIDNEQ